MNRTRQAKKLDSEGLWSYALKTLGGRGLASGELRIRLQRRAEKADDVDAVIGRLKDYGYLNDRKFAESYATSRLENEGLGRQRVLRDLRQRRVAPAVAENAVRKTYDATDEVGLIEDYLSRKFRNVDLGKVLSDPARLASVYRKLRYAGFGGSNSIRVLKRYSERAEELEDGEDSPPAG
jgi:regulatory protein